MANTVRDSSEPDDVGPDGYKFMDSVKLGLPIALVVTYVVPLSWRFWRARSTST